MEPLTLTGWQRRRLERQLRAAADARLYRRTLAVLEFARGRSIAGVAGALGVSRHSVYNWVTAYAAEHDPEALHEGSHTGRPSLWTEEFRERLRTLLGQSPQDLGYAATDWTVPLLQEHLERCTGQRFSDDTVRRELQRQRYVWKRPRYVLEPDPELEKKNGGSAAGSVSCGPGACCWPRTRPTCCCSRPCGRAGPHAAGPRKCS